MKQPKTYDVNYYFDLECDDDTPDFVIEELFEKAIEEIEHAFREHKRTSIRKNFDASGDLSYVDTPEVDEDKMKGL